MVYAFLEHHIGTKRHTHIVDPGYEVSDAAVAGAMAAFERMAAGEPLQYVTGFADFYGRQFRVTPDVLIPRPETELLCRIALELGTGCQECGNDIFAPPGRGRRPTEHLAASDGIRILDMCTGSGCIAWTLALEIPGAEVTAVDISDGALEVASSQDFAEEMARTGAHAPTFIKADVLCHPERHQKYDIIVSNPPYVMDKEKTLMRRNVREHEPHLALFVSDDDPLIFYRAVARWSAALLKPEGYGLVEINEALGLQTAAVFREAGFSHAEILQDLSGRDRFVLFHSRSF